MKIRRWGSLTLLVAVLSGCADDPFAIRWEANPMEFLLYSLDVDQLGAPTAFDMYNRAPVVIEDPSLPGGWDFAMDRQDGQMVFLPATALGLESRAGITTIPDTTFLEVTVAPADSTGYVQDEPVPVELGNVYVVRTHEQQDRQLPRTCVFYGKLEPLAIDLDLGQILFLQDVSQECSDRDLVGD